MHLHTSDKVTHLLINNQARWERTTWNKEGGTGGTGTRAIQPTEAKAWKNVLQRQKMLPSLERHANGDISCDRDVILKTEHNNNEIFWYLFTDVVS